VALILRFEEANPHAANALLKTLEEPPPQVVIMLTAREPEGLIPTIVSRSELIRLRILSLDTLAKGLHSQHNVPPEKAEFLAHITGGRPGTAFQYLQHPDQLLKRQSRLEDLEELLSANRTERFAYAERQAKYWEEIGELLQTWSSFWRDVLLVKTGSSVPLTNSDRINHIQAITQQVGIHKSKEILSMIERTQYLINRNINKTLALEVLMLNLPFIT
jgi:DNA polymerase-3 subunit delta'